MRSPVNAKETDNGSAGTGRISRAQWKSVVVILCGMALCGVLNMWLLESVAEKATTTGVPDRWTSSDMRRWVEETEKMTGINLPTPEHKP